MKRELNGSEDLFCIIGMPAHHSLSPAIHNAAFERYSINAHFLAFDVPEEMLENAMLGMRVYIKGMTLTSPHKEKVMKFVDIIDKRALELGAVNTVVKRGGKLFGYNTDSPGFIKSLEKYGIEEDAVYTIFGAGGAAHAFAFGLLHEGVKRINIVNRTASHADGLKSKIEKYFDAEVNLYELNSKESLEAVKESKYLINATNITLENKIHSPVPKSALRKDMVVFDANYAPLDNKLLRDAKEKGCKVIDGLELLVNQGVIAFELFTGERHEYRELYRTMMNAALEKLNRKNKKEITSLP